MQSSDDKIYAKQNLENFSKKIMENSSEIETETFREHLQAVPWETIFNG